MFSHVLYMKLSITTKSYRNPIPYKEHLEMSSTCWVSLCKTDKSFPKISKQKMRKKLSVGLTPRKRRGPRKTCPRNTPWLRKGPTITWVQGEKKKHALLRPNHKWHEGVYTLIPKVHPSSAQKTTCESGIVNQVIKFHLIWWLFDHFIKSGWVVCRNLKEVLANSMWLLWNLQAIWVVACYYAHKHMRMKLTPKKTDTIKIWQNMTKSIKIMCGKLYLNLFQKMNKLEKKWQRSKISQATPPKKTPLKKRWERKVRSGFRNLVSVNFSGASC